MYNSSSSISIYAVVYTILYCGIYNTMLWYIQYYTVVYTILRYVIYRTIQECQQDYVMWYTILHYMVYNTTWCSNDNHAAVAVSSICIIVAWLAYRSTTIYYVLTIVYSTENISAYASAYLYNCIAVSVRGFN